MNNEKLTICFHPWMLYVENDDYDSMMTEIVERGFNCVRLDDGAGLLRDKDGNAINEILVSAPFGSYTKYTTWRIITANAVLNIRDRLLRICRAAKKYNVKLILSGWFFLHTNWFCQEKERKRLFDLSTEEKIRYFADELSIVLDMIRQNDLIDVVAFAEILNEFDGLLGLCDSFASEYEGDENYKARILREIHEREIEKLKEKHPDILFAFDTCTANVNPEIIPRNIDVLNFHCYYAWSVYDVFERDLVCYSTEDVDFPDDIRYYLKENVVTATEVIKGMGGVIRTGKDWPRRISLYASIDEKKDPEITELLDNELSANFDKYMNKLYDKVDAVIKTHDAVVPNSRLVMGEGATCCLSPTLEFERDSECFWKMIKNQMTYLKEKNLWGTIICTSHAPGRLVAWDECKDLYKEVNSLFAK